MGFEEKNATKYLATFPYPYMNGYLHLGKSRSQHAEVSLGGCMTSFGQLLYSFVVFNFCLIRFQVTLTRCLSLSS